MKCNRNIFTALLVSLTLVNATPIGIEERDGIDPQFSAFMKCIQKKHPNFPSDHTKPTGEEVRKCVDETKGKTKREMEVSTHKEGPIEGELIYEPSVDQSIESRGIIDKIIVAGKDLYLDRKPWCEGSELHDNFVWVDEIRGKSNEVCKQLREQIEGSGVSADGGVGLVIDQLTDGHDKQGNQLKDSRKVTATYILNYVPPAKATIDEIKQLATGVYDLCHNGIEKIATKDLGCTKDIGYYRPSKAKHYTGTGAIGGNLQMFWDTVNSVADLSVSFSNDG